MYRKLCVNIVFFVLTCLVYCRKCIYVFLEYNKQLVCCIYIVFVSKLYWKCIALVERNICFTSKLHRNHVAMLQQMSYVLRHNSALLGCFLDHYIAKTVSIIIFYTDVWNYVLCVTRNALNVTSMIDGVQSKLHRKCIVTVHSTRAFTSKPHPNLSTMLAYQCGFTLHLWAIMYQKCLTVHIFAVTHPV